MSLKISENRAPDPRTLAKIVSPIFRMSVPWTITFFVRLSQKMREYISKCEKRMGSSGNIFFLIYLEKREMWSLAPEKRESG